MDVVTDRRSDPFDMRLPCDRAVPGYGDPNAHFHVVGDHPGIHGGETSGVPFTERPDAVRLQRVLAAVGLLRETGAPPAVDRTFLSYLHPCVPETEAPSAASYDRLEPFFDAELRAITAHVLLPVGDRAIEHVLATYTARVSPTDPSTLHATEVAGGGFLVVPIAEPGTWTAADRDRLVETLTGVVGTDYRREADLGRFLADGDSYLVR